MKKAMLLLALLAGLEASAKVMVDVMIAFDTTAIAWMVENEKDVVNFSQSAIERMNSVLPATDLDQSFEFNLAGTFVSAATAPAGMVGQERLANVLTSVASASRGAATGSWKDVQAAREQCKADLVVVLVDTGIEATSGISVGGVSWCLEASGSSKLTDFAKMAYSVVGVQEVESGYILIHEIGHLMGAGHSDRLTESPGPQLYKYSSAWHATDTWGTKWYTIMGYPYLSETDYGFSPYPAFSSATHTMEDGTPLGDATHDNTRTLRESCTSVAQFRISGNEGLPASAAFSAKTVVNAGVRDAGGTIAGLVQVTVAKTDKKGVSKVSAVYYGMDGKKKSAKAVKAPVVLVDNVPTVQNLALTIKGFADPLTVTVGANGSLSGQLGEYSVGVAGGIGTLFTSTPRFQLGETIANLEGYPVLNQVRAGEKDYHLLPDGDGVFFSVNGKKWVFAKNASVKYVKDKATNAKVLSVDTGKSGEKSNLCSLKLSVNAKTGVFKGSFTAYANAGSEESPKLKKYKFTVTGLIVDGCGVGQAVCKKIGPFPVSVGE